MTLTHGIYIIVIYKNGKKWGTTDKSYKTVKAAKNAIAKLPKKDTYKVKLVKF